MGVMYSRSVEYALRALTYLGRQPKGTKKLARQIARSERVPVFFLAKTLQQLARNGVLSSVKGPTGGFALDRPPGKITMMEVIQVLDGPSTYDGCIVGLRECNDQSLCPVHDSFRTLRDRLKRYLSRTTIAHLVVESEKKRLAAKHVREKRLSRKTGSRKRSKKFG